MEESSQGCRLSDRILRKEARHLASFFRLVRERGATSHNAYARRYVHYVHEGHGMAILFNYGDCSHATDVVKRRFVRFLGRENERAHVLLPRPRILVVVVDGRTAASRRRDFDIYSAVRREIRKNCRRFAILK